MSLPDVLTGRRMSTLEADRARVADLAAQILRLESSLSALRTEKVLAEKRLDTYKYPVLTLPNEIISEIFLHFLPIYPRCPLLTGILSPTLLTQIGCKWREIALTTPALWRAIELLDEPDNIPCWATKFTDNSTGPPKPMETVEKIGFGSRTGAWWRGWNRSAELIHGSEKPIMLGGRYDTKVPATMR
jgi:hypothetical protein